MENGVSNVRFGFSKFTSFTNSHESLYSMGSEETIDSYYIL
jgi:hypothetical protein